MSTERGNGRLPASWQSSLEPVESSWLGLMGGLAGGLVLKLA